MTNPIPDSALDDRLSIVGVAGSGKTYCAMGRVERLLARKARVVIPDPLGVWWGLRLDSAGKAPSGFDVVIFGGPHGDLPLTEHAGALIGETVAGMRESCILDLSALGTKASERRFMLAFLTALYKNASGEPVHVVFDEADMWAPQRLLDKEGDAAKLLGMMETIVRRGRVKGFIPWLISQRPAVISKDVLSQTDGIITFKLTSVQDRDAIGDWVQGQADKKTWADIWSRLPTMGRGQGVVWIPARDILSPGVQFPAKLTFDSSRTPKRGETVRKADLPPLDVGVLKTRLSKVEAETKANDPKLLRSENIALRAELEKLKKTPPADPAIERDAYRRGEADNAAKWFKRGIEECHSRVLAAFDIPAFVSEGMKKWTEIGAVPIPAIRAIPSAPPQMPSRIKSAVPSKSNGSLGKGQQVILIAIAQNEAGVTREQLSVLTGYKRSSRDTYLQHLSSAGYIETSGNFIRATHSGIKVLGSNFEPLPTGSALRAHWLDRLPEGERRILGVLIDAYPGAMARDVIDAVTGYKRSSRDTYLQKLGARKLIDVDRAGVKASDILFE